MIKAIGYGSKPKKQNNFLQEIQKRFEKDSTRLLFLTFLHLPLGVFLYSAGLLGIIHPLAVFGLGMYWAFSKKVKLDRIAYLTAYLVGFEIIWRMAQTPIFWEFGKYGSSLIMIAALLNRKHYKIPVMPAAFIILLIPACLITLVTYDLSFARERISFNFSGPAFLFVSCWFFYHLKVVNLQIKELLIFLLIPLFTVAATTLFYTVSSEDILFSNESNVSTSGGFGPNQVSSMLGLGVFITLACYLLYKNDLKFKLYFAIGALFLAAQSVLTFSRGGIYNALGAIGILILFQLQNISEIAKKIVPFILFFVIFLALIFPFLDDFTGGKLLERFEETGTTGRMELIEADFEILAEDPIWGVGLGNANQYRESILGKQALSHTEFSRLISEHGLFGILALIMLIAIAVNNFFRQNSVFGRALIAGVVLWCCLFMLNAGMRLAAPSFLWGFSFINIVGVQPGQRKNSLKKENQIIK